MQVIKEQSDSWVIASRWLKSLICMILCRNKTDLVVHLLYKQI